MEQDIATEETACRVSFDEIRACNTIAFNKKKDVKAEFQKRFESNRASCDACEENAKAAWKRAEKQCDALASQLQSLAKSTQNFTARRQGGVSGNQATTYVQDLTALSDGLAEATKLVESCKGEEKKHAELKVLCPPMKKAVEESFCTWRQEFLLVCGRLDECYKGAVGNYNKEVETRTKSIINIKAELKLIGQVICWAKALGRGAPGETKCEGVGGDVAAGPIKLDMPQPEGCDKTAVDKPDGAMGYNFPCAASAEEKARADLARWGAAQDAWRAAVARKVAIASAAHDRATFAVASAKASRAFSAERAAWYRMIKHPWGKAWFKATRGHLTRIFENLKLIWRQSLRQGAKAKAWENVSTDVRAWASRMADVSDSRNKSMAGWPYHPRKWFESHVWNAALYMSAYSGNSENCFEIRRMIETEQFKHVGRGNCTADKMRSLDKKNIESWIISRWLARARTGSWPTYQILLSGGDDQHCPVEGSDRISRQLRMTVHFKGMQKSENVEADTFSANVFPVGACKWGANVTLNIPDLEGLLT